MDQLMTKAFEIIEKLEELLPLAAHESWMMAQRQVVVKIINTSFYIIIALVFVGVFVYFLRKALKEEAFNQTEAGLTAAATIVFGFIGLIACASLVEMIPKLVGLLVNPQYHAIRSLIEMLTIR